MEKKIAGVDLRIFGILLAGAILGLVFVIPYTLTIQKPLLQKTPLPMPLEMLIPIQIATNAFIYAALIFVGLIVADKVGLGTPLLEAWLEKKPFNLKKMLAISVSLGVIAALLIIILDVFLFSPRMPPPAFGFERPPAWQGFLASFYGGIAEEVQLRLFLISLFVWGASKIRKGSWGSGFP